jgi:hypothetical protein
MGQGPKITYGAESAIFAIFQDCNLPKIASKNTKITPSTLGTLAIGGLDRLSR